MTRKNILIFLVGVGMGILFCHMSSASISIGVWRFMVTVLLMTIAFGVGNER